jgi:hypothetical protein
MVFEPIYRAYRAQLDDVNPNARTVVARINTACVDRYRTVIDPKGITLRTYLENRVVLWEHGRDPLRGALPVGRNVWVKPAIGPDGPELLAKTEFFGGKDEFAQRVGDLYLSRDMKGFSVNVLPKEDSCSPPTHDEIRERPELKDCVMVYRSSELLEYSAVAVPGNQEALTVDEARTVLRCLEHSIELPAELVARAKTVVEASGDKGEPKLPPLGGRSYDERLAEMVGQLRGLFDPQALAEDLAARADLMRGRV